MIGKLVAFAFSRVAHRTFDTIERRVVWSTIGALLAVATLVFALTFAFWLLQAQLGGVAAAAILAGACAILAGLAFAMPTVIDRIEERAEDDKSAVESMAETVDEEANAAVDYLGPLQVVISAFMLGLTSGRQLRKS